MLRLFTIVAMTMALPSFGSAGDRGPEPNCGTFYTYEAETVRVIDGDTVVVDVYLGLDVWLHNKILRLAEIDAPELKTAEGDLSASALAERVLGKSVFVCTVKAVRSNKEVQGGFGRYLATIYHGGENINYWLVRLGHAELH